MKHVTASGNGWIWGTNANDLHLHNDKNQLIIINWFLWVHGNGILRQIEGRDQYAYGVNGAQNIYTCPVDGSSGWRHIPGKLKYITAGGLNEVFGVDTNNHLWRSQKPAFKENGRKYMDI